MSAPRPHLATLVDDFRRHGQQTAVVTHAGNRGYRCSWAELAELSGRFAAELVRREIGPGERVVIWGANSAEWVGAFFGCVLRGVLAVPLDAQGDAAFAQRVVVETRPRLLVGDGRLLAEMDGELLAFERFARELPAAPRWDTAEGLGRETPLQIVFTSGTTSEPKGIVHTHGNVLASLDPIEREMAKYLRYERLVHPLRFLHTLPLSHVFGQFMGLWIPPLLAAEVHYEQRLEAPRLVRLIQRERISVLAAVPRVLELMEGFVRARDVGLGKQLVAAAGERVWRRWWRFRAEHRLLGWKFWAFVCGGATVPAELEHFWTTLGFALIQGYGMTETTALVTLNHPFKTARGSIGRPLAGREMRIAEDGEIEVRGASIADAVWQGGGMQQRANASGWLRTGDLAARDGRGELVFSGRKGDVMVTAAGLNVYPQDLEAELLRQAGVRAAAVVEAERGGGKEMVAVMIASVTATEALGDAALAGANGRLAAHQRMHGWVWWPEPDFPRTTTGKVRRRQIGEWVAGQRGPATSGRAGGDDLLLRLIAAVPGVVMPREAGNGDALRLREDLHLDSLGLVALQSMLETRFGVELEDAAMQSAATVGDVRGLVMPGRVAALQMEHAERLPEAEVGLEAHPRWAWSWMATGVRAAFRGCVLRPLVWLLGRPRVEVRAQGMVASPMLLVANHVTAFDVPLLLYALPRAMRRDVAVAMGAELLLGWKSGKAVTYPWLGRIGPVAYWLTTLLFNVFPLPRGAGFRRSFAHAGEALDRRMHVMVFPEGRRAKTGEMAEFLPGIGLLAQESGVPVLPMYLSGLAAGRGPLWSRRGRITVRVGEPLRMASGEEAQAFAARLETAVKALGAD